MNAALPLIIDRLLVVLPTLDGWSGVTVIDGQTLSRDSMKDYATVGHVEGEDFGGSAESVPLLGDLFEQSETLRSQIVSQTGDSNDMKGRRDRVFALYRSLEAWVQHDSTLGVPGVSGASLSWDYEPVLNGNGSAARLGVTLTYTSRGV